MPKKVVPLSNLQVNNAKPKEREYNLTDGDGLFLRIKPNGTKQWLFNYYPPYTKKRKNISFGSYPDISLASARKARADARELLSNGLDPKVPKEQKDKNTLTQRLAHETTLVVCCI